MATITPASLSIDSYAKPKLKVWERNTRDIPLETRQQARYLGGVKLNNSRLNAFSSLKKGDVEDFFSFKSYSRGPLRLGKNDDPYLRVELMDTRGKVIADSDANSGKLFEKFLEFNGDGVDVEPADFYVRVSRLEGDANSSEHSYSIQLSMGDEVRHDFDTIEAAYTGYVDPIQAAMANSTPPAYIYSYSNTASLLSQGLTSMIEGLNRSAQEKDLIGYAKVNFTTLFGGGSIFGK